MGEWEDAIAKRNKKIAELQAKQKSDRAKEIIKEHTKNVLNEINEFDRKGYEQGKQSSVDAVNDEVFKRGWKDFSKEYGEAAPKEPIAEAPRVRGARQSILRGGNLNPNAGELIGGITAIAVGEMYPHAKKAFYKQLDEASKGFKRLQEIPKENQEEERKKRLLSRAIKVKLKDK